MRHILLTESDDKTFVASVPSLPNVRAQGETVDVALLHIKAAIEQRLNELSRLGEPTPDAEPVQLEFVATLSETLSDDRYHVFVAEHQQLTPEGEAWAINKLQELIAAGQLPPSVLRHTPNAVSE
jgi:predicted RNase H-like HicB family nuclease